MQPLLRTTQSEKALDTMLTAVKDFLPEDGMPYIEPFCGMADIPFTLEISHCLLNDNNPHIINLYRWVKSGKFLENGWLITRRTDLNNWAENRTQFNELIAKGTIETVEAAQLMFYLSHISLYSNFATNNAFIGVHDPNGELPNIDWAAAAALMQNWELSLGEYTDFVVPEGNTLVVNAPPIYVQQWNDVAWDPSDHQALLTWLETHSGKIIVFHRRRAVVQSLYAHWTTAERVFQVV
ncbi:DNA adenine methylase [Leptothoe sp. PORK10 BA2]|uniref:DNA adenine methylase n=1 Tax=Leptothoe sp. PORK10 BA2 TaxID=3110254 RepID=UPI002B220FDD|nr:DNA adenine methylase [Leptothoe sp. PORK10 BA2]MEA5465561.1 DNA adenine methylase [Leptothoe sp. PORK10 BA2]